MAVSFWFARTTNRGLAGDERSGGVCRPAAGTGRSDAELWQITNEEMLPAVQVGDCAAFGEAVYRFGRLAGECFAAAQGGPFASRHIADLVKTIREFGVAGVGQSSWGPTVFAVTADETEAERLATWLSGQDGHGECEVIVARPNNSGATIERFGTVRVALDIEL